MKNLPAHDRHRGSAGEPGLRRRLLVGLAVMGCVAVLLPACTTPSARPPAVALSEVVADLRIGTARAFDRCSWLPGTAGFSFSGQPPRHGGQLVLFEQSLLWGFPDPGSGMFRVVRAIELKRVRSMALATRQDEALIVIEGNDGRLDSFGIERPQERRRQPLAWDGATTREAWRALLRHANLTAPQ